MRSYCKVLCVFGLQILSVACYAQQINVNSLHYSTKSNQARMLFDVSASPKHRVFVMDNPSRLVIDIKNAGLTGKLSQPSASHPLFSRVRAGLKNDTDLRIVVDLKKPITSKAFSLSSDNKDEHSLVVDLVNKQLAVSTTKNEGKEKTKSDDLDLVLRKLTENSKAVEARKATRKPVQATADAADRLEDSKSAKLKKVADKTPKGHAKKAKSIVIALDAGHGGDDPGAQGPNGTEEKKVTFAIAQKLAELINGQPGMKAVMVRKGDYYVGLRKRMQIARAAKADLFISIHADAFQDAEVRGASVYTLSTSGASSEAAHWLANSENAVDLVDGVSLDDKEEVLKSVLLDLSQTATQAASLNVAGNVLKSVQNIGELHKDSVQKAGFVVLKSPDIPSILVETAFISNPSEELNLVSNSYQSKMANAIFKGIRNYFKQSVPVESRIASL